jgi:pyridoxal phosphate enzyme (YggS family)
MTTIQTNLDTICKQIPSNVTLVAVSKTKPIEYLLEAYNVGQRIFGENKALEARDKYDMLPKDIQWHFIGHLQTNKIKYIAPFISLIHSVDSLNLLIEINKAAAKNNRIIPCLLQFYIAKEESKFGFDDAEVEEMLKSEVFASLKNVEIRGVMGMATFTDDESIIRREFQLLKAAFDRLKSGFFHNSETFSEISMGMTDDFKIAIEEGSTMVRVGSAIFGSRQYL